MLRTLIVDDDRLACAKLRTMIDWQRLGFEWWGEATNGANALKLMAEKLPDIVITDMNMPVMDGVELIGYLEKNYPQIKVVALSGYDDFEYVRGSLKHGAVDYILKHKLDAAGLTAVLNAARDSLLRQRQASDHDRRMQEHLTIGRDVAKRDFLNRLVAGEFQDKSELARTIGQLELELDMHDVVVALAEIDDFMLLKEKYTKQEIDGLVRSFIDICQKVLAGQVKAVIAPLGEQRFLLLLSIGQVHSELYIYNSLATAIGKIRQSVRRHLNVTTSFSVSRKCADLLRIDRFYADAELALRDKFFQGKDTVLWDGRKRQNEQAQFNLEIQDEKKLMKLLKERDREQISRELDRLFTEMTRQQSNYRSIQMVCADLINLINRSAREHGIPIDAIYSSGEVPYEKPNKYDTVADIRQWLQESCGKLIDQLELSSVGTASGFYSEKAMQYVQQNYHRNISMNDAAVHLGVNPSYFSHMFKEECGKGFVEYLNAVRVEKAKQLIADGSMKIKDIVEAVGFNSYNYFFRVFKEVTGKTPVEFKSGEDRQK